MIAHPECPTDILELADFTGSTAAMLKHVAASTCREFIVATEPGILFELQRQNPDKSFYPVQAGGIDNVCEHMKLNTLDNICRALETEQPELLLDPELMDKARKSIERMLSY